MRKIFKSVLSLCLAFAVCTGITVAANTAVTEYVVAEAETGYYSDITATSGTKLLGQLHDLITTSRTKYSSYADCKNYGTTTDPGSKSNTVMEFYTHIDIDNSKWDVSGGWNREHVWPKSISNGLWNDKTPVGGGADLHHIRPSEKDLNAKRGNLKYGTVKNGSKQYTSVSNVLGGYSTGSNNSGTFEPLDNVKGDIARILMYVYTHYNDCSGTIFEGNAKTNGEKVTGYQSRYFGTLNFTHIITATSESAAIALLLQWNESDPVDSIEITRNDAVYGIQGNRNPFIDHPEYADAIWGSGSLEPDEPHVEPDSQKTQSFSKAVANIVSDGALKVRLDYINKAIEVYDTLSDIDKGAVETEIAALKSAIAEYNETVKTYNEAAIAAESAALKSMGGLLKR